MSTRVWHVLTYSSDFSLYFKRHFAYKLKDAIIFWYSYLYKLLHHGQGDLEIILICYLYTEQRILRIEIIVDISLTKCITHIRNFNTYYFIFTFIWNFEIYLSWQFVLKNFRWKYIFIALHGLRRLIFTSLLNGNFSSIPGSIFEKKVLTNIQTDGQ